MQLGRDSGLGLLLASLLSLCLITVSENNYLVFQASTPTTAAELTEALAIDCEGVGVGPKSRVSIAARVSVVNERCEVVYDSFVKPPHQVTDYRTWITGIRRQDLENGTITPALSFVDRNVSRIF